MTQVITVERIKETQTYKILESRKDVAKMNFLTNLAVRKIISYGFEVFKNTGFLPTNVTGINISIVADLMESHKGTDYSHTMSCEEITPAKTFEEAEEWCKRQLTRKPNQ